MSRECLVFMADEHKEMRSIYNTIKLAFELFEKKDTNGDLCVFTSILYIF